MPAAARKMEPTTAGPILHLAFELGAKEWKLGFATGPGRPPRIRKIQAGKRGRRRGITAVARKVLVALWRYLEDGVIPEGAVLNGG